MQTDTTELDRFWRDILPDLRAAMADNSGDRWERYSEITEEYIRGIEWSAQASEHDQAIVAGNIRQFAYNIMRPLLVIQETQRRMYSEDLAEVTRQRDELVKAVEAAKPGYTRMRGTEDIIYHHTVHTLIALAARIQSTQPKEPDHG